MQAMSLINYPTTLLWIDDDKLLLDTVLEVFKSNYKVRTFSSSIEAMHYIANHSQVISDSPLLLTNKNYEEYDLQNHLPTDINFSAMCDIKNNPHKVDDIATMVIDYNMPEKNGLEICYELSKMNIPIKKILLTGEINHKEAVKAFNDGVIDCFMRKDEIRSPADIECYIKKMQDAFFCDMTNSIMLHLETDHKLPMSDPIFIDYYNKWKKENEIVEHYIIDKNGTFLTHNKTGSTIYFVVHTDRTLDFFVDLYAEDINAAPFTQAIKLRQKIPYFGENKEHWHFELHVWDRYFYTPNVLVGRDKYYLAFIQT